MKGNTNTDKKAIQPHFFAEAKQRFMNCSLNFRMRSREVTDQLTEALIRGVVKEFPNELLHELLNESN